MKLQLALVLRNQPLVLTCSSYHTSSICGYVAKAVNFARAGQGGTQILFSLSVSSKVDDALKENVEKILGGLCMEGEKLIAELARIDDELVKITITASK